MESQRRRSFSMVLLLFLSTLTTAFIPAVSADDRILLDLSLDHVTLMQGDSTNVTITVENNDSAIHDFNLTMKRPVKRIPTLMKQFGHKEIGVLKLDIEGAALSVLEDCQNEKIFPNIILGEIERDPKDPKQFTKQFNALIANLKGVGYEVYMDTSDMKRFFSSIEIYCVKR